MIYDNLRVFETRDEAYREAIKLFRSNIHTMMSAFDEMVECEEGLLPVICVTVQPGALWQSQTIHYFAFRQGFMGMQEEFDFAGLTYASKFRRLLRESGIPFEQDGKRKVSIVYAGLEEPDRRARCYKVNAIYQEVMGV